MTEKGFRVDAEQRTSLTLWFYTDKYDSQRFCISRSEIMLPHMGAVGEGKEGRVPYFTPAQLYRLNDGI